MIRLSVLYPKTEGASFDHDYYRDSHVPARGEDLGRRALRDRPGLDGPYEAAVHLFFESVEAMGAAMAAEGTAAVRDDVASYTTITPERQLSEVVE